MQSQQSKLYQDDRHKIEVWLFYSDILLPEKWRQVTSPERVLALKPAPCCNNRKGNNHYPHALLGELSPDKAP